MKNSSFIKDETGQNRLLLESRYHQVLADRVGCEIMFPPFKMGDEGEIKPESGISQK